MFSTECFYCEKEKLDNQIYWFTETFYGHPICKDCLIELNMYW